jgi:hypothetical protein
MALASALPPALAGCNEPCDRNANACSGNLLLLCVGDRNEPSSWEWSVAQRCSGAYQCVAADPSSLGTYTECGGTQSSESACPMGHDSVLCSYRERPYSLCVDAAASGWMSACEGDLRILCDPRGHRTGDMRCGTCKDGMCTGGLDMLCHADAECADGLSCISTPGHPTWGKKCLVPCDCDEFDGCPACDAFASDAWCGPDGLCTRGSHVSK